MKCKFQVLILFFISVITFSSCSNFVENLQKKSNALEQQNQQNQQEQTQQEPEVQPEVLYNIIFADFENGEISSSKTTGIKAGEEIILSVTAEDGYVFKSLTIYNAQNKDLAVSPILVSYSYKFTMPNSDVTVKVVFDEQQQNQTSENEQNEQNEQNQQTNSEEQTQQTDTNEQNQQTDSEEQTQQTAPDDTTPQVPTPTGPVRYRVEHYLQDVDGSDTYELYTIQEKRGEVGAATTAAAKEYPGFTAQAFAQPNIESDGTTIVRIYYNRNTITYTFNPNGGNWDGRTESKTVSGLYGAVMPVENPLRLGYDLTWDKTKPAFFEAIDHDFTANWTARTDTKYTVKTYEQKVEGGDNYILLTSEEKTGTTDTTTTVTASNKNGFDLTINQANIEGDGSTIVSIYYNRKSYTITFETNGGSPIQSQQVLYGATVQMPSEPTKNLFAFLNWYSDSKCETVFDSNTAITSDLSLYASYVYDSYRLHETVTKLIPGTDGTYGTEGEYVLFGDFPQSAIAEGITVDESIAIQMGDMTVYGGSDGNLYAKVNTSFFMVEPIKWHVLSKDENGKAVILAENILINCAWNSVDTNIFTRTDIFTYLNSTFLNYAFTTSAQEQIEMTTIIPDGYNFPQQLFYTWEEYASDAKVFLLSEDEALYLYDFPSSTRIRSPTAYATANGASNEWWLRTSNYGIDYWDEIEYYYRSDFRASTVYDKNVSFNYVTRPEGGVVPALTIYIED